MFSKNADEFSGRTAVVRERRLCEGAVFTRRSHTSFPGGGEENRALEPAASCAPPASRFARRIRESTRAVNSEEQTRVLP
ncbi:hypothetical protein F2P81_008179 [Scophthalmus maximus]|uniref:Uncharacterized protein n=1 Tax=Scophthalmus maximus TaxID=52904 RepID=A0A6A4T9U4_SCOMX|nr:hypothetical protein F2P81_008179 [Scophthalmus maximus]